MASKTPVTAVASVERLVLSGVSKTWEPEAGPVLDRVDIALGAGALVALIGSNGAGKTTLLRIAAGLIGPDEGRVRLDGFDPFSDRREFQQRLGYLSAGQGGLYARISITGHLEYWARIAFVPRASRRNAIEGAIERFQLRDIASRRVDRLSTGQRQRARLAMAFLHDPTLVLLDEPQSSLDEEGIHVLNDVLAQYVDAGGTAVCCSPRGENIDSPSYVLDLHDGRLTRQ